MWPRSFADDGLMESGAGPSPEIGWYGRGPVKPFGIPQADKRYDLPLPELVDQAARNS